MASVFQQALLLNASVYENAALGLKLRGLNRRSTEQRVLPWLERLGIAHLARRKVRVLSGGEAQRTSLARALALDPELLLLDEPFSALDHPTRERLLLDLETILGETGITTVFVTHDRNEAFVFGDRVGVLLAGRLLQVGATAEVFAQPVNEVVAHFVGVENRLSAVVETATDGLVKLRFNGGSAEVFGRFQPGERVLLCLRPEDINLNLPCRENEKSSPGNRLTGRVVKIISWESHYRLELQCGRCHFIASVTKPSFLELELSEGKEVVVSFEASAAHLIKQE